MDVCLIRHTTPDIDKGICYGQADVGLAKGFRAERNRVLAKLEILTEPDAILSSPSSRCTRLAGTLPGHGVVTDERLLEMNFGDWELKPWHEIERDALDIWATDFVTVCPPGGENLRMVYRRTAEFIEHLLGQPYRSVLIVTHAGVILCFWAYITDTPLQDVFQREVEYGDVFAVKLSASIRQASIRKIQDSRTGRHLSRDKSLLK